METSGLRACGVVWRESQCTFLAGRRWPQMLIQRQSRMEWGLSFYSQIAFLLSPPSSPTSDIFHPLCASSLNSEHLSQGAGFHLQHWAALSLLWRFSLVPTPVLRNSASPGNDMGKALFLQIQKRQESSWLFSKALPEKGCQNKTVLFCHVRSWKVVKGLENPTPREKRNLRSENLLPKSRDIKAWMDLVICEWCVHQASPEVHVTALSL